MKATHKKPRICIVLPDIHYLPYSTYVLNTQPLLPYLEQDFDVTLVFRKTLENPGLGYSYLTILDQTKLSEKEKQNRNAYFSPDDLLSAWKYTKVLDNFVQEHAKDFDLVIERQWSLVGALSGAFSRYGVPTVSIVEAEFYTKRGPQHPIKKALHLALKQVLPHLRRRWMQKTNSVVVETDQMKSFFIDNNYVKHDKPIYSIPNGIDPKIFFPQARNLCREKLGINKDTLVLTYVGSLNRFIQEPGPMIEALGREKPKNVILHIIGDGSKRKELEDIAKKFDAPVIFHGRLQQEEAALYIGAANICIAPYNKNLFPGGKFTSASLKVCEYLACGRPVMTIPCERMEHLLSGGKYGLLVENTVDDYSKFFKNLPSMDNFSKMESSLLSDINNSVLREKKIVLTWGDIADMYKEIIKERLLV